MKKKALGFYLSILTAILTLVCVYLYGPVSVKNGTVRPLLVISAVLTIIVLAVTFASDKLPGTNLLPIVNSILCMAAIGLAIMPMVTQIVYVLVGMTQMSTIQGFITYAVLNAFTWFVNVVAAFLGIVKKSA